jgi:hypothetical protein
LIGVISAVWNALLIRLGFRSRPAPVVPEKSADLIGRTPELRELLARLGHNPRLETESARLMAELKSSIRAEITDYAAFRSAVAAAVLKRGTVPPAAGNFALLDSLSGTADVNSALAVLNADPIDGQVPFIEQIPVAKGGQLTWRSPVDHSLIRRRPVDLPRFAETTGELERLYSEPYPARSESMRLEVLDAIARLRRELERDKSYLPTPLQFLQTKLQDYKTKSLSREAADLIRTVLRMIDRLIELRRDLAASGPGRTWDLAGQVAEQAALYLAAPGIQIAWLTNRILGLSLHASLTGATGQRVRKRDRKNMELIRREIAAGYFDPAETARRLHRMEGRGFDVISLVYPLLRLNLASRLVSLKAE